jgi:hypothetical protein
MRLVLARLGVAVLVVGSVVGCEVPTAIPAGAEVVEVTITPTSVVLQPDTIPAGDVYLALQSPGSGSYSFVARQDSATATAGPLTEDGIEALASGDTFHTSSLAISAGGCSPAQDEDARGKMGHCGNVTKVVVSPGRYAIVAGAPEGDPASGEVPRLAILTVVP